MKHQSLLKLEIYLNIKSIYYLSHTRWFTHTNRRIVPNITNPSSQPKEFKP